MNCVNYLMDDAWLVPLRSKEFKIRVFNTKKLKKEQNYWTWMNTLVPIGSVLFIGLIFYFVRKYKYAK